MTEPDADAKLREFLRDRDVPCPACGYNLRDLSRPQCPECRQDLSLTVGVLRPRIELLLATLAPCAFSGIAAALLLIPMVVEPLRGGGSAPWFVYLTDAFGWLSGLFALLLVTRREQFLRLPRRTQLAWAALMWTVHVGAFVVLVSLLALL